MGRYLQVTERRRLPLHEVSGLGVRRRSADAPIEVVAIGDDTQRIAFARPTADGTLEVDRLPRTPSLPAAAGGSTADRSSQWEAVAGDAAGRVLIVQEAGSVLTVLGPDLAFERSLTLDHPWSDDGWGIESLLLMRQGHVLVAKQRRPVALAELAPRPERALGLGRAGFLGDDDPFEIPDDVTRWTTVRRWLLDPDATLDSINDLDLDPGGAGLLAISSRSRCIVRLEQSSAERAGVTAGPPWKLPGALLGDDRKAEGLLSRREFGCWVAIDTHDDGVNLVRVGDGLP